MRMEEHEITLVFVMSFRPATGFYAVIADYYASAANLNIFIVNVSDNTVIGGGRGFSRPAVEYILNNNLVRTRAYDETIDIDIDKVIGREEPYTERTCRRQAAGNIFAGCRECPGMAFGHARRADCR